MKKFCAAVAFALLIAASLSAQSVAPSPTAPQTGPDLSGRWTRDAASSSAGSLENPGWGSLVEIKQSGVYVTAQPLSGKPQRYRLDGGEMAEVVSVDGCKNEIRVTQSISERGRVTITTWLITKSNCVHGEIDDEPVVSDLGPIEIDKVRNRPRRLESITVVAREGNALTVDMTRSVPGGVPTSTTTTYRK